MSRRLLVLLSIALGCHPEAASLGEQPPIQTHLVVHVDPLVRGNPVDCDTSDLKRCGSLQGVAWQVRTQNLVWLAEQWIESNRAVDVQLGPEAALGWAEDPAALADLGMEIGASAAADTAQRGAQALAELIEAGVGSLGLHVHAQTLDASGAWGDVQTQMEPAPCENLSEVASAELVVHTAAMGVDALASELGADIETFTGHLPRTLSGKADVLDDPDSLDPDIDREFPSGFVPTSIGSAYSECFQHRVDHPPFEVYPAHETLPLAAGGGPPTVPGLRVVGSMASHLGVAQDGSVEAAARRWVQILLNWRYAALMEGPDRPWTLTMHTHLFDLMAGQPNPMLSSDRQRDAIGGQHFRHDLARLAGLVDRLARRSTWAGVGSTGDGIAEWRLPRDLVTQGSAFSVGSVDDPFPEEPQGPYLPLVTERLAHSHLDCATQADGVDLLGFERCSAGWVWGDPGPGYGCADGSVPDWVAVMVPAMDRCTDFDADGLWVGRVDGTSMTKPRRCAQGLFVPLEGLIVEGAGHTTMRSVCEHGLASLLAP